MKYTRVYKISDLEELKLAERMLNKLLNKYEYIRVNQVGIDEIKIAYM